MRKFTLIIASLLLTVGAMAQTFVAPEVGKQYKIKGDSESHPWLTANMSSGGNVVVSANEDDAAVFEKTENGLKAVSTGKYLGYSGGKYTYNDAEITVELLNTGDQANNENKYAILSGGNYMYNNNTDGIVHESSQWLDFPRLWGFIENKVLADGVYTIQADENGRRGYLAISSNANHGTRPVLTEISWSNYSGNSCTTIVENSKYWYVKTIDGVTYLSNIGNGKFIYDNGTDDINYRSLPYGLNVTKHNNYIHVGSGTGTRFLSMGCGATAPNQVKWEKSSPNDGGCLLTFTLVADGTTNFATQIAKADFMITSAPKAGNYYRIKAVAGRNDDAPYLSSENSTANSGRAAFTADNGAKSIFYFNGSHLLSYASGNYLVNKSNFLAYNGIQTAGTNIDFNASSVAGAFNIIFTGNNNGLRSLYCHTSNYTDAGGNIVDADGYRFNIEAVETLPVTITAAGYATLYAPVALEIPADVKAYTVANKNSEVVALNEIVDGVIPANTGVVLEGEEGEYDFVITTTENTATSILAGTVAASYITADSYVLGVNGGVGFYTAEKNQQDGASFKNNSHKAYLPMANITSGSNAVSFYGLFYGDEEDGTTAIEAVVENAETVIFDLAGRKVSEITAPGIYIVNGKKVIK